MISIHRRSASRRVLPFLTLAGGAALAAAGCAQILGLDSYKEGAGGSASSGTISSGTMSSGTLASGTMSSGTMSSGTMSSGTMATGAGGGGGAPPATCSTQGSLVTVMSDPTLSQEAVMTYDTTSHNTFVATSFGGMMSSGVKITIVRDNGNVDPVQTFTAANGGVSVDAIRLVPGMAIVYARVGNQIGEVQFPVSGSGLTGGAATFVAYNDIPDVACSSAGFVNNFTMRQPIDTTAPRYVAVCHHTTPDYEKVYVGDRTTSVQVSQEVVNEPADKLQAYFALPNGQQIMFAGGDPSIGTWYRAGMTPAELATKRSINVENDPMRVSLGIAETLDPMGGIQAFVATLDKTSITPARMYVVGAPANNLNQLSMTPPPGLTKIADITMLGELAGFSPLIVTAGRLGGAGSTVDRKTVLFTWLKADGTLLTRELIRTADVGLSIGQATAVSTTGPTYLVGWGEGNQTNTTIYAQAVLCVGG